ncbi:hypothetical protein G3A_05880 [Bacillus sp. 17376]|uniref:hypothetical protein n=1 Tax=Mesobacillus boroniphilus TaxID=308892 RepID=UPI0003C79C48|nr:hypothetical protein [Mesobacillus boroniphilus]ESU33445.1 hypothetical protein G3A_05880 [Bacillus sp. 17376]
MNLVRGGRSPINVKIKPLVAGLISGIALGLFLKLIQSITSIKVYTLLLNVDYIPILKDLKLSEVVEFGLHIVISIGLAFVMNFYIIRKDFHREAIRRFVIRISLIVGLLLYPTTLLSERTPPITSAYAFLFWMAGHWIYGFVLGRNLQYKEGERV